MKAFTSTALLLGILAAGAWALALREVAPVDAAQHGKAATRGQLVPYPGTENLVVRRVVAEGDGRYSPSPDGTRFIHVDASGDLAILDLRTGESRPVLGSPALREGRTGTSGHVLRSRFSPDGQRIAYQLNRDGLWAIRVVDLETGEVSELLHHPETHGWIDLGSWSPDGQTIATALFMDGSRKSAGRIPGWLP